MTQIKSHATRALFDKSGIRPKEFENAVCLAVYGFKPYEGGRRVVQALKDVQRSEDGFPRFLVGGEIPNDSDFYQALKRNNEEFLSKLSGRAVGEASETIPRSEYEIEDLCKEFADQALGLAVSAQNYPKEIAEKLGINDDAIIASLEKEMNEAIERHRELAKLRVAARG